MRRKVILAVIDGLGPAVLDRALAAGRAPTLAALADAGTRDDGCVSTFPSLTPVCLAAIVTGEHPAGSGIPSMSWYHRGEGRFVEYGSSLAATLAEGTRQTLDDLLVNLNMLHLSPRATTIFEALEDAGLDTAAVNSYVCRGRVRHPITRPAARRLARGIGLVDAVYGPRRYFLGELFYSDVTGAPRNYGGTVDRHGGHVGRWLVTRDGFDFLMLYLAETDAAQHYAGDVIAAVAGADASIGMLVEAAGGLEQLLERYAVVIVADHGQSRVREAASATAPFDGLRLFRSSRRSDPARCDLAVSASNRTVMAYLLPGARLAPRGVAARLEASPAVDVVLFAEEGWYVARRAGGELRFRHGGEHADERGNRYTLAGDRELLPEAAYPNALERIAGVLDCHAAGDVVASPAAGYEFLDAGGHHHVGGGSHGSLLAEDSLVPVIAAGFDEALPSRAPRGQVALHPSGCTSITDLAPLVRRHFGVGVRGVVGGARLA